MKHTQTPTRAGHVMRDLYAKLLVRDWDTLPETMRRLHSPAPFLSAEGLFTVTHARSWLVTIAILVFRLPAAGEDVPLRLEVDASGDRQRWDRTFGQRHTLVTYQYLLPDGRLAERTGPLELTFHVEAKGGVVSYRPAGLRLCLGTWRIPLPSWCGPRVTARLWVEPHALEMNVMVRIAAPLLGEMLTYGGPLELSTRSSATPNEEKPPPRSRKSAVVPRGRGSGKRR